MLAVEQLFSAKVDIDGNYVVLNDSSCHSNQQQTNESFSTKWKKVAVEDDTDALEGFQRDWYLDLYGFDSVDELKAFLASKKVIMDAGSGLGYKAAWFADLAPESIVIGIDLSEAASIAAERYRSIPNLCFVRGDIAATGLKPESVDYVSCDQVIMHAEDPGATFRHLAEITSRAGQFACYVYAKKALPRELLDDYFRVNTHRYSDEQVWEMSEQLTQLGKALSDLNVEVEVPDIPLLGIKGGNYDVQRFIYWNFLKCFWNEELGKQLSDSTNFDWYSPSNAKRYSEQEFLEMVSQSGLKTEFFHREEACYSGRFSKVG